MKKSLIVLPLVALLLVGCNSGKKSKGGGGGGGDDGGDGSPCLDFGPDQYNGYRRCKTAPKAGKEYLLGFYHIDQGTPRFMNGDEHKDDKGTYRYYLGTTTDVANACKLEVVYADDKEHYAIHVIGGGEKNLYDDSYLEIYEATKSGKTTKIASIRDVDDPVYSFTYTKTSFVEPTWNINTSIMQVTDSTREDHMWGVFGCSGSEYETISAIDEEKFGAAFICHFWEKM